MQARGFNTAVGISYRMCSLIECVLLMQARGFNKAVGITGIVLTKLDGTSKGGVVVRLNPKP